MIMKYYKWLFFGLFLSIGVQAKTVVDVYGTDEKTADYLVKKYENRVAFVEEGFYKNLQKSNGKINDDDFEKMMRERMIISKKIMADYDFSYVDISTVLYPGNETLYTTIDVIDKNNPERMKFVTMNNKGLRKPDVIDKMMEYSELETSLMVTNQLDTTNISCPVYHCVSGFHHPKLKPYLSIFNQGVQRDKKLIIDTLNHDQNPNRRAAAAFLMGHFQDPKEIVSILSFHVDDPDDRVRNNVIRVISETLRKSKITIDVSPFLSLLDSPFLTDRNKSLSVIWLESESSQGKRQIIQSGGDKLLSILALKQPNNHDLAYRILKNISGKDFGEYNIAAWKQWLSKAE
jgi:hypothetical protein